MGRWADCNNIEYVFREVLAEPELLYKGYYFKYAPIETALWSAYVKENGFTSVSDEKPLRFPRFRQFLKDHAEKYLDKLIYEGYTNVGV